MRKLKLPIPNLKKVKANIKGGFNQLAEGGFQKIFDQIDQISVKKSVDQLGLDKFITQCALLAAGSGAITGVGGVTTLLIGVPLDLINLISQQFRVTMAVSYYHTGSYQIGFTDFFKIVASSFKVDAKMATTKKLMEEVAEKLMLSIGTKTAERLVPVVGAVIGGTANYLFIKRTAAALIAKQPARKVIKL